MKYIRQFNKDLWVLSFGWFVSALGFGISIPFISIYFHSRLGLTITQIGLFFGFMAVVRSIFQALGGEMSDHLVSGIGYVMFSKKLPDRFNR